MADDTDALLAALWADYVAITPLAARVHALLRARGETVHNDHVALRSFGAPGADVAALAAPFERHGWRPRDRYVFADKHLVARYWDHPDPTRPKVFISELVLADLPARARGLVDELLAQLPTDFAARLDLPWAGRPWHLDHGHYLELLEVSEYAAWVAAFGFRVNHFTVDVGRLRTVPSLAAMNTLLQDAGFALNTAGGVIKGSAAALLEQSSTLAEEVEVDFDDGTFLVPSCYYEFARRYPTPTGELFGGFVPASADRLFESTDVAR
ncbi:MAG: DUF1338 domain-containing protein [Kofleriaceae bacterium]|nr:DUF1338 domain-containing protein [Kofleriaceae bacterium]